MSSRDINKVTLIGNLTSDPNLKELANHSHLCRFTIATHREYTNASGVAKSEREYHNCISWDKMADLCGKILHKSNRVYVEGRMVTRKFVDATNVERTITEVVVSDFISLTPRTDNQNDEFPVKPFSMESKAIKFVSEATDTNL